MVIRTAVFIIFSYLLLGCTPIYDPSELRTNNGGEIHFVVNKGYQEVYRKIIEYKFIQSPHKSGQIYADIKKGEIVRRSVQSNVYLLIDVIHLEDEVTKVDYFYYFSAWRKTGEEIKDMFKEDLRKEM